MCDGGKLCFSISLILLWLTVSFCFRHIGLSIQRSKDRLGIRNVIFRYEIVREICRFEEYGDPPSYNPRRQRAQPSEFETIHVPRFSEQKKSCVVNYLFRFCAFAAYIHTCFIVFSGKSTINTCMPAGT